MPIFIIQELFLVSIGVIVFLVVRKLPQVDGFDVFSDVKNANSKISKIIHKAVERFDYKLGVFLEKVLRKLKVLVMRLDNIVSNYLKKTSQKENGNGNGRDLSLFEADIEDDEDDIDNEKEEDRIIGNEENEAQKIDR